MKKTLLITSILILALLVAGCQDLSQSISRGKLPAFGSYEDYQTYIKDMDKDYFAYEHTMSIDDLESLDLEVVFEDVRFIYEDRQDVEVKYFGVFEKKGNKDKPKLKESLSSKAKLHVAWEGFRGEASGVMEVRLPHEDFKEIRVDNVSGDIEGHNLRFSQVNLETVSGHIHFKEMHGKTLNLESVSGEILVSLSQASSLYAETVSGDIKVGLDKQDGDLSLSSVSGDISLSASQYACLIEADSVSGNIKVDSGVDGSGNYDIKVETVSGDISITNK